MEEVFPRLMLSTGNQRIYQHRARVVRIRSPNITAVCRLGPIVRDNGIIYVKKIVIPQTAANLGDIARDRAMVNIGDLTRCAVIDPAAIIRGISCNNRVCERKCTAAAGIIDPSSPRTGVA